MCFQHFLMGYQVSECPVDIHVYIVYSGCLGVCLGNSSTYVYILPYIQQSREHISPVVVQLSNNLSSSPPLNSSRQGSKWCPILVGCVLPVTRQQGVCLELYVLHVCMVCKQTKETNSTPGKCIGHGPRSLSQPAISLGMDALERPSSSYM